MSLDPFRIDGPAVVSFSGGRTSALMLRRILDAHRGNLPPDVHVLFANTGKEREETLQFVWDCEREWNARVHWLEWSVDAPFVEVGFETASREGEPFEALIGKRKFLPNPVTRYCTQELKIRVMKSWMVAQGYEHWTNIVGIRADEPRRVAKMRAGEGKDRWDIALPLAEAGVTENDVLLFWKQQPFDLQLRTWEGNCDLCFLKGTAKRKRVIEDRPDLARWWVEQEVRLGATFRADTPSYAALATVARDQLRMFANAEDELGDCVCSDGTSEAA